MGSVFAAPQRTAHTMMRTGMKASGSSMSPYSSGRYSSVGLQHSSYRRSRPSLDYASDTEATCSSSPRSSYYYYRDRPSAQSKAMQPRNQGEIWSNSCLSKTRCGGPGFGVRKHLWD